MNHFCLLPQLISGPAREGLCFCLGVRERRAKRWPLFLWRLQQQYLHYLYQQRHSAWKPARSPGAVLLHPRDSLHWWGDRGNGEWRLWVTSRDIFSVIVQYQKIYRCAEGSLYGYWGHLSLALFKSRCVWCTKYTLPLLSHQLHSACNSIFYRSVISEYFPKNVQDLSWKELCNLIPIIRKIVQLINITYT